MNHLAGHVAVDLLEHGPLPTPCVGLLVSGGHTSLLEITDVATEITELGGTIDDAAGEAYDKVARLLGLPYPGGPHIDAAAAGRRSGADPLSAGPDRAEGPRTRHRFDFSFSGLKTAVARWVEMWLERDRRGGAVPVADVAASFQEAVCDVLATKAMDACAATGATRPPHRRWRGGQPSPARAPGRALGRQPGWRCAVPRPALCTDNGAMIAALGAEVVVRGGRPSSPRRRCGLDASGQPDPALSSMLPLGLTEEALAAAAAEEPSRSRWRPRYGSGSDSDRCSPRRL